MWYNRFNEYLSKEGYRNDPICPRVFIKRANLGFAIILVYVDDLNIIGIPEQIKKTVNCLKKKFDMKFF